MCVFVYVPFDYCDSSVFRCLEHFVVSRGVGYLDLDHGFLYL